MTYVYVFISLVAVDWNDKLSVLKLEWFASVCV